MPSAGDDALPFRFGRALMGLAALTVAVTLAFRLWPGLDLAVSGLFYDPAAGFALAVRIVRFGGDGPFALAREVSGYCRAACTFVSTEVAAGTALTAGLALGALWFAGRPAARVFRRLAILSPGVLVLTAVRRIGSGRHYLSDVVFAALPVTAPGLALACPIWSGAARSAPVSVPGPAP